MRDVKKYRVAFMTRQRLLIMGLKQVLLADDSQAHLCDLPTVSEVDGWIKGAAAEDPSVVIVDCLSRLAFKTVEEIRRTLPNAYVLLWVMDADVILARKALDLGVRGLIRSDIAPDMLRRCLHRVAEGEMWFDRNVTEGLMNSVAIQLSRREYQLLVLVSNGLSNKEIADSLVLSEGTVKFYLSRLFKKCSVSDRLELALFGLRHFFQNSPERGDAVDLSASLSARRVLLEQAPQHRLPIR
jgi:DNA-binding NarL/FixJ family response regulator